MSLAELAVLYALVGAGCAAARVAWRSHPRGRALDAALLATLWPLYGPFLLLHMPEGVSGTEVAFLTALRRARDTPLGAVLPDPATARALGTRLRVAAAKVAEIDAILARPAFSENDAERRLAALRARDASACAISTATLRVQNIRRMRALRARFAGELEDIAELLVQLTTQAEVVRLAGASAIDTGSSSAELVRELVSRVEGLDQMLDDDPQLLDARV